MKKINRLQILLAAGLAGLVWLGTGCATTPNNGKQAIYFFPPPPDEPHFQYLTAFSSEKQFRGGTDRTFMNFVTGTSPLERDLAKPYGVAAHGGKIYICDTEFGAV